MARKEHRRRSFHSILTQDKKDFEMICCSSELDDSDEKWNPPAPVMTRSHDGFLEVVRPVFRFARRIKFIDPYLDFDRKTYLVNIQKMVDFAETDRRDEFITFEFHTSCDSAFKGADSYSEIEEGKLSNDLIRDMKKIKIGKRTKLKLFIWSAINQVTREKIHNRYILSEYGGIGFGHGLQSDGGSDDPFLLSKIQFEKRCRIYSEKGDEFRLVKSEVFQAG